MTSTLKVNTIQHTGGTTGITVASDGKVAMPNTTQLGVGQTWTDVTSCRAKSTEYQNTTGAPIMVSVSFTTNFTRRGQIQVSSSSGSGFITIADADGGDYYSASADTPHYANITVIIPNNIYYKLVHIGGTDTMTVQSWVELR